MAGTLRQRIAVAAKAAVGVFSDNAAQAAYGMLGGIYPGGLGQPPVRGTREFLRAYSQMPWLRAITNRIATNVASTEWQLFVAQKPDAPKAYRHRQVQRAGKTTRRSIIKDLQGNKELKQIDNHPLLELLHDANSFQTGEAMRKVTQLHLDLVGDAFWLKERASGGPLKGMVVGLWPLPPDWVLNTPTPATRMFRVGFRGWRGLIPDTEFVWISDPDPANPYARGSGTAQALADELETDEYAAKYTKAYFYNQGRPDFLVYPKEGNMRPADVKRLEDDWTSRNSGFWRAFKPYFTTREVGVFEFASDNLRSMQFVQLRQFERDMLIQTFGVPPEIIGVLASSNRATVTAADMFFNKYVIEPRLELLRGVLQERLVPEFDDRLIIDYVSPVQSDKEFELSVAAAAPYILDMDEWRDLAGKPPLDDEHLGQMRPMPMTISLTDPSAPPPDNPKSPIAGHDNPLPGQGVPGQPGELQPTGPGGKPPAVSPENAPKPGPGEPGGKPAKPNEPKPAKPDAPEKPPKPGKALVLKPKPRDGESRDDYMHRCIPQVLNDGTADSQDQAVAICSSMFERGKALKLYRAIAPDMTLAVGEVFEDPNRLMLTTDPAKAAAAGKLVEIDVPDGVALLELGATDWLTPANLSLVVTAIGDGVKMRVLP